MRIVDKHAVSAMDYDQAGVDVEVAMLHCESLRCKWKAIGNPWKLPMRPLTGGSRIGNGQDQSRLHEDYCTYHRTNWPLECDRWGYRHCLSSHGPGDYSTNGPHLCGRDAIYHGLASIETQS